MRNSLRLLAVALLVGPALAPADKKDDELLEISRDVGSLSEQVRTLQKAQADNTEALKQYVQQATGAFGQMSQEMAALKNGLTATLSNSVNEQQTKITTAVSPLASQMDALSRSMDALSATISQMNARFDALDKKMRDIDDKVSTINQPLPPPAAPVAAAPDPNVPPPGVTNISLWEQSKRDYERGSWDLAQKGFADYIRFFPNDTYAPWAGYYLGMISMQGKDYDGAAEAFQKVIDTYPSDNKAQDALYQKGQALEKGGHRAEALDTYRTFISKYPANEYVTPARQAVSRLTGANAKGAGKRGPATAPK